MEKEKGGRPELLMGTGVQRGHGVLEGSRPGCEQIPVPELVTGPAGPAVLKRCQQWDPLSRESSRFQTLHKSPAFVHP